MGEYKTLYIMRLQLFWPKLREDVKQWVKFCAHCVSYNIWRTRKHELHFSQPVTIPFNIIHIDIWSAGTVLYKNQERCHLFKAMCDLTQFIIFSITTDNKAESLSKLFMEEVVLSFVIVLRCINHCSTITDKECLYPFPCWYH